MDARLLCRDSGQQEAPATLQSTTVTFHTTVPLRALFDASMAGYNQTRFVEDLLDSNEYSPPSFTVNLYPEHWNLNGGSKFLYNNQVAVSISSFLCPESNR